jgi:signal peptidase I
MVSGVPYLFRSPARGDVVEIHLNAAKHRCAGSVIVKRIVGLPNEVVSQRQGRLTVNGHRLSEAYLPSGFVGGSGPNFASTRLGHSQFFVMGDNRGMSCDSREFGAIDGSQIIGKVLATL